MSAQRGDSEGPLDLTHTRTHPNVRSHLEIAVGYLEAQEDYPDPIWFSQAQRNALLAALRAQRDAPPPSERQQLEDLMHNYVYQQAGPSVSDTRIHELLTKLDELRNSP